MIFGIGVDIVAIKRIQKVSERFLQRFLTRIFTKNERIIFESLRNENRRFSYLAKRFAAKEACAKAIGTGLGSKVHFQEIGVDNQGDGRPFLVLTGDTYQHLLSLCPRYHRPHLYLSLSDEKLWAQAFVIISLEISD